MTNGEKIQKDFNCKVCEPIIEDDIIHVIFADKEDSCIGFDWSWWCAKYEESKEEIEKIPMRDATIEEQKPTGVEFCDDCVSRQAALDKAFEIKTGEYTSAMVVYAHDIRTLPPVTPIHKDRTVQDFIDKCRECGKQKKGKWIFTQTIFDKHGCTVECSSCHKKWKTYDEIRWKKENKFCPNCGVKMEE